MAHVQVSKVVKNGMFYKVKAIHDHQATLQAKNGGVSVLKMDNSVGYLRVKFVHLKKAQRKLKTTLKTPQPYGQQ